MSSIRLSIVFAMLALATSLAGGLQSASAQNTAKPRETGFGLKKPVFGGACTTCPWGAMGIVVRDAMKLYGWDIQICHYCAGGPRAARMVSGAMMATPPDNPTEDSPPTPNGPLDFGATGAQFLQWAYEGINEFSKDPEGPRKHLRLVANIQEPTWLIVAVKADSGITSLAQIVEKKLPVDMVVRKTTTNPVMPMILEYYGLTEERVASFGGTWDTAYPRDRDVDVLIGWASMVNSPEYNFMYQASQKYDLKYLELPPDLRAKLVKAFYWQEGFIPEGLFRGVTKRIPAVVRTGTAIYGRTDMPDDFAYTLAKAMDEHKDLLQWSHMNFSYNERTVWKDMDVPLHPGAARYYKERGYMK